MSMINIKQIKRAVFTVEAAVILPITALILTALIGYIYFAHENVWCEAAVYEAGLDGTQHTEKQISEVELTEQRLSERHKDRILGFANEDYDVSSENDNLKINWKYGILSELFGDMFTIKKEVIIKKIDPVQTKRLMWAADRLLK